MSETVDRSKLVALAALVREKNALDARITEIVGRPALIGHLGEYIASAIFDITLHESATYKGSDGIFTSGRLAGRNVNIKWYAKNESILDLHATAPPDFYLVLAGPTPSGVIRGGVGPWLITSVYLFDALALHSELALRQAKIGIAASVRQHQWLAAEIYPEGRSQSLTLTSDQCEALKLFANPNVDGDQV